MTSSRSGGWRLAVRLFSLVAIISLLGQGDVRAMSQPAQTTGRVAYQALQEGGDYTTRPAGEGPLVPPSSPLQITLTALPSGDAVDLVVRVASTADVAGVSLEVITPPELKLLSSPAPSQIGLLQEGQAREHRLALKGKLTSTARIEAYVRGIFGGGTVGDLAIVFLGPRNGGLAVLPEEELAPSNPEEMPAESEPADAAEVDEAAPAEPQGIMDIT